MKSSIVQLFVENKPLPQGRSLGHAIRFAQLVFPRHGVGWLPGIQTDDHPPPIGLLTLAAYARKAIPDLKIEVIDGNHVSEEVIFERVEAPVVGIGTWFSNYEEALRIARFIKTKSPMTTIVLGGPHVSGLGGRRILHNNPAVDLIIVGDAEQSFVDLLRGAQFDSISGLAYRDGDEIIAVDLAEQAPLDSIPVLDLDPLVTPYRWGDWKLDRPSTSWFPLSAVRGCPVMPRCDYCSIATKGVSTRSPSLFWQEVLALRRRYGIDLFFETGDIFPIAYANRLLKAREELPLDDRRCLADVRFRVYLRPGTINARSAEALRRLGVHAVFIGYESILCFKREGETYRNHFHERYAPHRFTRIYPAGFTTGAAIEQLQILSEAGISVMAAFILGLPGESEASLRRNQDLVATIAGEANVPELLLNIPLPFPGTQYFAWCLSDSQVLHRYQAEQGVALSETDRVDYSHLSRLFVDRFTSVGYDAVAKRLDQLIEEYGPTTGHFGARASITARDRATSLVDKVTR